MQQYQQFIDPVIQTVLGVLASVLVGAILGVGKRVTRWIDSRTTVNQRDLLHKLADESVAFAKTVFVEQDGTKKLEAALGYVDARLAQYGVQVTEQELRAAIEKAYLDYKARTTQPAAQDPVTVEVPVEKPLAPEVQQLIDAAKAVAGAQHQQQVATSIPPQTTSS